MKLIGGRVMSLSLPCAIFEWNKQLFSAQRPHGKVKTAYRSYMADAAMADAAN